MSLLMDALKKAEEAKELAATKSSNEEERVALNDNGREQIAKSEKMLDDLTLLHESAETLLEKPIENSEPVESELSLEPKESIKPESHTVTQDVAPDSTKSVPSSFIKIARSNQSESAKLVQEIKSEKSYRDLTDATLGTTKASVINRSTVSEKDKAQRIFKVSPKRNSRQSIVYLVFGLGFFLIISGVGYYFYSDLTSDIQQISAPVSTQTVEPDTELASDALTAEEPSEIQEANFGNAKLAADASNEIVVKSVVQAKVDEVVKPVVAAAEAPLVEPLRSKPKISKPKITQPKSFVKPKTATKPILTKKSSAGTQQAIKTPEKKLNDDKVNIVKQDMEDPILAQLEKAYKFYQVGNFANAKQAYENVLSRELSNRDARLGLAAIAFQNGDLAQAHRHYKYLLRINPKDSVALSGVMSAITGANALKSESQIKLLLDQEPQAAHLHFTLGNLMAAQSRWSDAQQAYFQAYRFDPDNADYAYNLAVSLDYLGQQKPAVTYYQKSMTLSKNRNVNFSADAVVKRINSLMGNGGKK